VSNDSLTASWRNNQDPAFLCPELVTFTRICFDLTSSSTCCG
jgi:hypothetical protein